MNAPAAIGHNGFDPDQIMTLLDYCPATGAIRWKERERRFFQNDNLHASWNRRYAGAMAGTLDEKGYIRVFVFGRRIKAHRIALCIANGEWPTDGVDHINGDPSDNRLINLREASRAINNKNAKLRADNSSGVCGVSFRARSQKWAAQIQSSGKKIHLGYFPTIEMAAAAREDAAREFGFHENHGRAK